MRAMPDSKVLAVLALTALLAGCPGEKSDPQPQSVTPRTEAAGLVTDGVALRSQSMNVLGSGGPARTVRASSAGTYSVSMTELSPPYLFTNTLSGGDNPDLTTLIAVTPHIGNTNVTPLTTLLTAQLLGVSPQTVIGSFVTGANIAKDRITEAGLRDAQVELTAFLQDSLGVQVTSGTASFNDATFNPAPGDAMFDTILALNAKMAADGTTLEAVAERIATGVHACDVEQALLTINGAQKKFCPITKGAVPEEADTSILDYTFRNIADEILVVKARDKAILSIEFTSATQVTYSCEGAACTSASLGPIADDESQPMTFASTPLTSGGGGSALLTGTLVGPPPSIELPTLPCSENRYFLILSNHSVVAECIPPGDPFNLGGNFSTQGGPDRENVSFGKVGMQFDTDAAGNISTTSIYFQDRDPDTNEIRNRLLCRFTACNGVVYGEPTLTPTNFGFSVEIRTITLTNTLLTGLDENGVEDGTSGSIRGSFVLLRLPGSNVAYPVLAECDPAADTITATTFKVTEFNVCIPPNDAPNFSFYRQWSDLGDGFVELDLKDENFNQVVRTFLKDGVLDQVVVQVSATQETYTCSTDCAGVTVTGPDVNGDRTLMFSNTVLRHDEAIPLPSDRTLTLTSGAITLAPQ
jgi:hypothetical protein